MFRTSTRVENNLCYHIALLEPRFIEENVFSNEVGSVFLNPGVKKPKGGPILAFNLSVLLENGKRWFTSNYIIYHRLPNLVDMEWFVTMIPK